MAATPLKFLLDEINFQRTKELMRQTLGTSPCLYRPKTGQDGKVPYAFLFSRFRICRPTRSQHILDGSVCAALSVRDGRIGAGER